MPALDRYELLDEDAFRVECETGVAPRFPLNHSANGSPSSSGDFTKDGKMSSYGSTDTTTTARVIDVVGAASAAPAKDPELSPLLGALLPGLPGLPGGRTPSEPCSGLTSAEILPFVSDPFWCRLRAAFFGLFWVLMAALLASVVMIVVNDPQPCSAMPPSPPLVPQQTVNVSLPLSALHALHAVSASRY